MEIVENKEKSWFVQFLESLRNYLYLFAWIIYFWFYFSSYYENISKYIIENIFYWSVLLQYSNAVMAFFTVLWIIWVLNRILKKTLVNLSSKTKNNIDDVFVDYLIRFIKINKYFLAIYVFFRFLTLPENYLLYINKGFYIIVLVFFIYYLTKFLNITFETILIKKTRFKSLNKNLLSFIKKIVIIATWIIWVITILWNLGYNITALITWAWIGWLAIALAAQKTLSNVFWAITVLLTKPFEIGDFIRIDWQTGTIKEMWLSHLTMVDKQWFYVLIPNEKLISNNIENLTKRETRRTDFSIGIIYDTTLKQTKKAVEIIENILEQYNKNKSIDWYRVNFDNFWDFSLNINSTYFSLLNDNYFEYVKQKEEINLKIKEAFEKENIEMAFPTQEIIIKK